MKVICINGVSLGCVAINKECDTRKATSDLCIYEGEVYTVLHECQDSDSYILQERNPFFSYGKKRFMPLSEVNETEFERNYIKEKV